MTDTTEKPNIDERYARAGNSRNLSVEEERTGDADVLIAAGWSRNRLGSALLRLHSEWDSAEKPRMSREVGKVQARDWLLHEQKILMGKLKTLPAIREAIGLQVISWGWEGGEAKAASVILWWLDQTCPECHGTRYETVQGTNRHSAKACRSCGGTGKRTLPHGQEGKRLANLLDDCVSRARVQMKRALRFRAG